MRTYLDNCTFNRPFDDQSQLRIKLESEAKLYIQEKIIQKKIQLVWSYILEFENAQNPFDERRQTIIKWRDMAIIEVKETQELIKNANALVKKGLKAKDALHVASAIEARADYFITTDDQLIHKLAIIEHVQVAGPIEMIGVIDELNHGY